MSQGPGLPHPCRDHKPHVLTGCHPEQGMSFVHWLPLKRGGEEVRGSSLSKLCTRIKLHWLSVVVIQSLSRVWFFVTPWTAACQVSLSLTIFQSLLKVMSTELVMPSNHILCRPLLLPPQPFPASGLFSLHSQGIRHTGSLQRFKAHPWLWVAGSWCQPNHIWRSYFIRSKASGCWVAKTASIQYNPRPLTTQ